MEDSWFVGQWFPVGVLYGDSLELLVTEYSYHSVQDHCRSHLHVIELPDSMCFFVQAYMGN